MKRNIILIVCALLIVVFFTGVVNAEPSVTIEPSSVHRDDPVTISGAGWTPGQTIYLDGDSYFYEWALYPVVKDDGTFSFETNVPEGSSQLPVGTYSLFFYDFLNEYATSNSFEVLPGIIWTEPSSGPPGTKIKIYGDHFDDSGGRTESVSFDSGFLWGPDGPFDYQGCQDVVYHQGPWISGESWDTGECDYYIPKDTTPGLHKVIVGADGGVSTDFYVTPYDDNTPPSTAITLSGTVGSNDWYISDVNVTLTPTDNEGGSGVNKTEYSFDNSIWITYDNPFTVTAERTTTVYYRSYDYAGNIESTKVQQINIDKNIPEIIIYAPEAEKDYFLNEVVIADWSAFDWYVDFDSEMLFATATVPNGEPIDTSTLGSKTFSVETEDKAGHKKNVTIKYNVITNAGPSVKIEPSSVHRGDPVTISGAGWTPSQTMKIEDKEGNFFFEWEQNIHPVVKDDGTFSVETYVPKYMSQLRIGTYSFGFYNSELREQASAIFEVLPGIIWVIPESGPPGTKIEVYGDQFWDSAGHTDILYSDMGFLWGRDGLDESLDACQNLVNHVGYYINMGSDVGACPNNYYIPRDATPGLHKITVGEDGHVSTNFFVTSPTPVPEYPAIAVPMVALIGLVFILQRHRINR